MTTRTIRAWAVLGPLGLVLAALLTGQPWVRAGAGAAVVLGLAALVRLDGLRERGRPRRR